MHQRWSDGHTCATRLFEEICAQGDRGSAGIVRNYLRPFRELGTTPPRAPAPPKVRDMTSWLLRHPDSLDADEQLKCKEILARCPDLDTVAGHVASFAETMSDLKATAWVTGSPGSRPTSSQTCTRSPPGSSASGCRGQRLDLALQLRRGRGQRQPHQDAQAPDVRPRQLRPAPKTR
jgi:hypothetical protein